MNGVGPPREQVMELWGEQIVYVNVASACIHQRDYSNLAFVCIAYAIVPSVCVYNRCFINQRFYVWQRPRIVCAVDAKTAMCA